MKKITEEDKVDLVNIKVDEAEKLYNETLKLIKKGYNDLNMDYDVYAFEKATAQIVKLFDEYLTAQPIR